MRTDASIQKPVAKTLLEALIRPNDRKVTTDSSESKVFSAVNLFNMDRWRRSALARRGFFFNH